MSPQRAASSSVPPAPQGPPAPLSRLVGRDDAVDELTRLLPASRLLTLTGPGGSGKTRLAVELARRAVAAGRPVAWVDLSSVVEPHLLPARVAAGLGVGEDRGPAAAESVAAAAGERDHLLVLDNCEHLVEATAELVERLLAAGPRLGILATSREALRVPGERAWLVPPLTVPRTDADTPLPELAAEGSVQLFTERASEVSRSFALTVENAPAVARICRRLEGMPLAIELAAARSEVLSVEQIADRLDDVFRLLVGGPRRAASRHRTLRATIDWSYSLLDPAERRFLARLGAFAGGFSLEAAEAVAGDTGGDGREALDLLAALVAKSLVLVDEHPSGPRYRLLDTVRRYALEKLREMGAEEEEDARRRHAALGAVAAAAAAPHPVAVGTCRNPPTGRCVLAQSPTGCTVRVLGPLEITVGDRRLTGDTWGATRAKELLFYLLCHPAGATKAQIGLALWPDASPAKVHNSFHVTLHRLRRTLGGGDWVVFDANRYRIDPGFGIELDADRFEAGVGAAEAEEAEGRDPSERLEEALALYRGPLFEGETVGDWHLEMRDRLEERWREGLRLLGALYSRQGRWRPAAEAYRRLATFDGLDEEAHRGLITAFLGLGDRARARRTYDELAERLRRELAVEPEPETVRLLAPLRHRPAEAAMSTAL